MSLSIAILVWLIIGFIVGLYSVKDFDEQDHREYWESSGLGKMTGYPKKPKMFDIVIYTSLGLYGLFVVIKNRLK
ncbi:hypothetical protein CIL05_07275 [Virgibacillus profundi]|uniref:Uncharacterized protein n=1 Tax=Virgibacillus profundi TaxID=2024555 RepID=A0A2A2IFD2_9BACI|nr:hypothetical protein [Virgibacillus profundi]PAV30262.1 hypothetical protein CIL05_07275 [Virgibacillus profundi]PXY54434.1 hypothetical protein CIT14_07360 [Virgibacillus profundi]